MNGYLKPAAERLYLHKDDKDEVYVESLLHQHHIDGIRFLYKQFKQKNPGVIVNNPLGYGNSMLVALFLGAVKHLLDKPILILCEESEEHTWLEHFQRQNQCNNAVVTSAESPFLKKSIFINTMDRLEQFSRRDWAVLVVDNDAFLKEKSLQTKFKADFKIWITPLDMKDNLQTLALIFKWLFPKEKLNLEDYKAKPGDVQDAVAKAVSLDALLRDIVCRTHLLTPFETHGKSETSPKNVSKKNKDATGTKIKRSKRLSDSAGASNGIQEQPEEAPSAPKISKKNTDTGDFSIINFKNTTKSNKPCDVIDRNDSEMDVESFILNEKPISYKDYKQDCDRKSENSKETTDLIGPTIFDSPEKGVSFYMSDDTMDVADNKVDCVDSDNSDSLMPRSNQRDESQKNNLSEDEFKINPATPESISDKTSNGIKSTDNDSQTLDESKSDEPAKVEPDKIMKSPKKDIDSKMMDLDEKIFKKFQGSLLDRLF